MSCFSIALVIMDAYLPTFENWNAGQGIVSGPYAAGGLVALWAPQKVQGRALVGIPGGKAPESWMKVPILA